tara:strand:+ start:1660 stop:2973 length:1314 start_codon:yes stop_codon:yes gene_type:complete
MTFIQWDTINIILNRERLKSQFKKLLLDFDERCHELNYKKGFYIYGSPGCGKTEFVKTILKEIDYDSIWYDAGDVRNKGLIDTITSNNISKCNVLTMMQQKKKNIVIVMDEIDGMNNGDKGGIASLIKLIRQKKTKKQQLENETMNPIICIGNKLADKKIRELMKVCNVFELPLPTNEQISTLLQSILGSCSTKIQTNIVKYIQGDLRKIQFVEKLKKNKLLTNKFVENILHNKSCMEDSKEVTKQLFLKPVRFEEHNTLLNENDRTIVSLLYHENMVDVVNNKKNLKLYLKLLDNFCYGDYIDRITFQNQIWQFNEMSSLIKTFYNNYLLHSSLDTNNLYVDEVRFTKILTKYSTEYNNQQFIFHMCQELNLDKKDLFSYFQEIRNKLGSQLYEKQSIFDETFVNENINKLDIKRIYKYMDKSCKKELEDNIEYDN